jgi:hypothetical protein
MSGLNSSAYDGAVLSVWFNLSSDFTYYIMQFSLKDNTSGQSVSYYGHWYAGQSPAHLTVGVLNPSHSYSVAAVYAAEEIPGPVNTNSIPVVSATTSLSAIDATATTEMTVAWEAGYGSYNAYLVAPSGTTQTVGSTTASASFSGPFEQGTYQAYVRVTAGGGADLGPSSAICAFSMAPPTLTLVQCDTPADVAGTGGTVTGAWNPSPGYTGAYRLTIDLPGASPIVETTSDLSYVQTIDSIPAGNGTMAVQTTETVDGVSVLGPVAQAAVVTSTSAMTVIDYSSGTALVVTWQEVAGAAGYAAYLQAAPAAPSIETSSTTTASFSGPLTGGPYTTWVRVTADNGISLGPPSAAYPVLTSAATLTQVQCDAAGEAGSGNLGVTVAWSPAPNYAGNYQVTVLISGAEPAVVITGGTSCLVPLPSSPTTDGGSVSVQAIEETAGASILGPAVQAPVVTDATTLTSVDGSDGSDLVVTWRGAAAPYDSFNAYLVAANGTATILPTSGLTASFPGPFDQGPYSTFVRIVTDQGLSIGPESPACMAVTMPPALTLVEYDPSPAATMAGPVGVISVGDAPCAFLWSDDGQLWRNWWDGSNWLWSWLGAPPMTDVVGPVGASSADGNPYAFVRGGDGHLWSCRWDGTTWLWDDQGTPADGVIVSGAIGVNQAGMAQAGLTAFVLASDGQGWANWWDGAQWQWIAMGAPSPGVTIIGSVGVTTIDGGLTFIFVLGDDGQLWVGQKDDSGSATTWICSGTPIGGTITAPVGAITVGSLPCAFVVGGDSHLWQSWWTGTVWQWDDLGTPDVATVAGGIGVTVLDLAAAGSSTGGRQAPYVFVRGSDGHLWLNWWDGTTSLSAITAAQQGGSLGVQLWAIDQDRQIWTLYQTSPGGDFSGWEGPGFMGQPVPAKQLAAAGQNTGNLMLFLLDLDGTVWSLPQTSPGGGWGNWTGPGLAGQPTPFTQIAAVQQGGNRGIELWGIAGDGQIWTLYQATPGGTWSKWEGPGFKGQPVAMTRVAAAGQSNGTVALFSLDAAGSVWEIAEMSPGGNWGGWSGPNFESQSLPFVEIAAAQLSGGLGVQLWATDAAGLISTIYQQAPGGAWTAWKVPGFCDQSVPMSVMAAAGQNNGDLMLFSIEVGGGLWGIGETDPNQVWGSWVELPSPMLQMQDASAGDTTTGWSWSDQGLPTGTIVAGPIGATTGLQDADGTADQPYAFLFGGDGAVWLNWRDGGNWQWSNQGSAIRGTLDTSWDAVAGYDGSYQVSLAVPVQGSLVVSTDQTFCTMVLDTALLGDGNTVAVQASDSIDGIIVTGPPSQVAVITATAMLSSVVDTIASGLVVSWAAVAGEGYYNAYLSAASGAVQMVVSTTTQATFSGPLSDAPYTTHVRVSNGGISVGPASPISPAIVDAPVVTRVQYIPATLAGAIGVGSIDDYPCAFLRDTDGRLWLDRWSGTAWQWYDQGMPPGGSVIGPAGVGAYGGLPYSFVLGADGHLWVNRWTGSVWCWDDQGVPAVGVTVSGPLGANRFDADQPGFSAFAQASDGHAWQNRWGGSAWAWIDLGTPTPGQAISASVGVVTIDSSASDPSTWILTLGSDGHLWAMWQPAASVAAGSWIDLGTPPGSGIAAAVGATAIGTNPYAFVQGQDGHLWLCYSDGTSWHWADQGAPTGGTVAGTIGVTAVMTGIDASQNTFEALPYAFVSGSDGHLWVNWQDGSHAWQWSDLGMPGDAAVSGPVGAVAGSPDSDGAADEPYAFLFGGNGQVWLNCRNDAGWQWSDQGVPSGSAVQVAWAPVAAYGGSYDVTLLASGQNAVLLATNETACTVALAGPLSGDANTISVMATETVNGVSIVGPSSPQYVVLLEAPAWALAAYDAGLLSLNWITDGEPTVSGYLITIGGSAQQACQTGNVTAHDVAIELTPGAGYPTFVQATDGPVIGPASAAVTPLTTAPAAASLRYDGTVLVLNWAPDPESGVTGYAADLLANGTPVETISPAYSPQPFTTPMTAGVAYSSKVRASGDLTLGPWSNVSVGPYQTAVAYSFDTQGRLVREAWANTATISYAIDAAGNIQSVTTAAASSSAGAED